jgi:hypothetical protein
VLTINLTCYPFLYDSVDIGNEVINKCFNTETAKGVEGTEGAEGVEGEVVNTELTEKQKERKLINARYHRKRKAKKCCQNSKSHMWWTHCCGNWNRL